MPYFTGICGSRIIQMAHPSFDERRMLARRVHQKVPVATIAAQLTAHWFMSLADTKEKLEDWRRHYNEDRPRSAIGHTSRSPCTIPATQPARRHDQAGKLQLPAVQGWGAAQPRNALARHTADRAAGRAHRQRQRRRRQGHGQEGRRRWRWRWRWERTIRFGGQRGHHGHRHQQSSQSHHMSPKGPPVHFPNRR